MKGLEPSSDIQLGEVAANVVTLFSALCRGGGTPPLQPHPTGPRERAVQTVHSAAADEFAAEYKSECRPRGPYGALRKRSEARRLFVSRLAKRVKGLEPSTFSLGS